VEGGKQGFPVGGSSGGGGAADDDDGEGVDEDDDEIDVGEGEPATLTPAG